MQNYFGIPLRLNVGNRAAMNPAWMAPMYHTCRYLDNYQKSEDTWCQYQMDKQENEHQLLHIKGWFTHWC